MEWAGKSIYLIHILEDLDLDPVAAGVEFVLFGHSHRPEAFERDGVRYVNPGAVGPRRFQLPVSFAFLDDDMGVEFVEIK